VDDGWTFVSALRTADAAAVPLPLVFTRTTAVAAGWAPRQIDEEVRRGRWTALRRGVYAVTALLPDDAPRRHAVHVAAAALATTCDVVGSHESAALVHGLPLFQAYEGPPVLSRCRVAGRERPDTATPAPLVSQVPPQHRTTAHGAPVTTLARTAADLARKGPALSAVVVLDAVLRAGVPRLEVERVLDDCRGWPGAVRAREWVAFADGRAESPLESVGRWRLHQAELPAPELQVVLGDGCGPLGRVDFYWAEHRTVGEADGLIKYRGSADGGPDFAALRAEKLREDALRDAGFEIFRFTWEEAVHRPLLLEQRARRAFARAALRRTS
jgi:hypothetical protein